MVQEYRCGMSISRERPFLSVNTVGDVIKSVAEDLEYQNLIDGQNKSELGNGYGHEFNFRKNGETIIRIIEVPFSGPDRSTINSYLKRNGPKSNKELFSVIVRSKESDEQPIHRPISPDITFMRIERRRATESVDIEHDLKFFQIDSNEVAPMYLDYFNDMTVGNRSYQSLSDSISEVFSLKKVTRAFYRDFAEIFHNELQNSIHGVVNKDENLNSYTQLVVNRVLFLMFVQEKGWLDGDTKYIQNRYKEAKKEDLDIYDDLFKPLFFEALNTQDSLDNDLIGRVPYLNGGLFERREIEKDVTIDDKFFDTLLNSEKNGHGDPEGFLLRYKLSLSESNPAEQELVVDPEFIGHIFEMFMQGKERSDKGAFYTPKEITQYMSKNALKHYLLEEFSNNEAEISDLVLNYNVADEFDNEELERLHNKIQNIDVVDPAVGSGAFIISMLEELIGVTEALNKKLNYERDRFDLKEDFIAHSLYGVDIDSSGIELCKFRTWLYLMQDLDIDLDEFLENNEEYALPNLGFKFFVGNSLAGDFNPTEIRDVLNSIGEEKSGSKSMQTTIGARQTTGRDLSNIVDEIESKRKDYIDAHGREKDQLEEELGVLINEIDGLIDWESSDFWMSNVVDSAGTSFKWSINIPEVILEGGFDIVIGNPPYKGGSNADYVSDLSRFYKNNREEYVKPVRKMVYDLYQKFIFRGDELVREGGVFSFITNSTFLTIPTKTATRNILQNNRLESLLLSNPDTFDAEVDPAIFLLTKGDWRDTNYEFDFIDARESPTDEYRQLINLNEKMKPVSQGVEKRENSSSDHYIVPISLYRENLRQGFFEPSKLNLKLYEEYIKVVSNLYDTWSEELQDVDTQRDNIDQIEKNHISNLSPDDTSVLGLLTWGGKGLQTTNNEEHIAYLEGSRGAEKLKDRNDDFKYIEENENTYKWISRVVRESEIINAKDLTSKEKHKGITDPDKNCWVRIEKGASKDDIYYKPRTYYIDWSRESLEKIKQRRNARLHLPYFNETDDHTEADRNDLYYFRESLFASSGGTGYTKVRYTNNSVIDYSGAVLVPFSSNLSPKYLLGILNSEYAKYLVSEFISGTVNTEISDMRLIPIPIPTKNEHKKMCGLVNQAIEIKRQDTTASVEEVQKKINNLSESIYGVPISEQ